MVTALHESGYGTSRRRPDPWTSTAAFEALRRSRAVRPTATPPILTRCRHWALKETSKVAT
jgi:hypothetical protein